MKMTCPHCKKPYEVSVTIKPPTKEELIEFEIFRDNYKGKKRGLITEMNNFVTVYYTTLTMPTIPSE